MLDRDACYHALTSRDRRFDGRFFVGVLTTGIYCRPICPSRTPRQKNVRFYRHAAAAEEGGFRPCRRCRPETSPGTPAWAGTSATVNRALRIIDESGLAESSMEHLADRLGVGTRHLRRLFLEHVGASPAAVVRTRRLHFARRLIDETELPMSEVAFASGFGSIRRFNAAFLKTFGAAPTQMRRRPRQARGDELALRLPYRPPLDWEAMTAYLAERAIPGVEEVRGGAYRRTVEMGGFQGVVEVAPLTGEPALLLRVAPAGARVLAALAERMRRLFDLGADPQAVTDHLGGDPVVGPLVRAHPGTRVPGAWDGFELAVRAILGQQITVRAATTLAGRIAQRFGAAMRGGEGAPATLFPAAATLREADLEPLGVIGSRASTIRALAREVADGNVVLDGSADPDETRERLLRIRGIGRWTAAYVAMRALRQPDAFPADDLGLRRAIASGPEPAAASELTRMAHSWRPWRAYAAIALWAHAGDARSRDGSRPGKS